MRNRKQQRTMNMPRVQRMAFDMSHQNLIFERRRLMDENVSLRGQLAQAENRAIADAQMITELKSKLESGVH